MTRKRKKKESKSYVATPHDEWLEQWSQRVGYVPPPAIKRGQYLRKVTMEGFGTVEADPTLFTSVGPSEVTVEKRASRAPRRYGA